MNVLWEPRAVGRFHWVTPVVFSRIYNAWIRCIPLEESPLHPDFILVTLSERSYFASKTDLHLKYYVDMSLLTVPSEQLNAAINDHLIKTLLRFNSICASFRAIFGDPVFYEEPLMKLIQFLKQIPFSKRESYYNRKLTGCNYRVAIDGNQLFAITRRVLYENTHKKIVFGTNLTNKELVISITHPYSAEMLFFQREFNVYSAIKNNPKEGLVTPRALITYSCNDEVKNRIILPYIVEDLSQSFHGYSYLDRLKIACQIITALENLFSLGFTHGDIKLENIRVYKGKVYLLDFQTSQRIGQDHFQNRGTKGYLAPEILTRRILGLPTESLNSIKIDDYALGVTLYELLYKELPEFSNFQFSDAAKAVEIARTFCQGVDTTRDFAKAAVVGLLEYDPDKRLSRRAARKLIELAITDSKLF